MSASRVVDIPHVAQISILPGGDSQGGGAGQLSGIIFLWLQAWCHSPASPMSLVNCWSPGVGLLG